MAIEHVIGRLIKGRVEGRKRSNLEDQLESAGLSSAEIDDLEPYIEYVVEYGGGAGKMTLFAFFGLVGLGSLAFGVIAGLPTVVMLIFIGLGLFCLGLPAVQYRKFRKARNLKDALLSDPQTFVDGGAHGYSSIGED